MDERTAASRTVIPLDSYTSADVFARERRALGDSAWHFAGFRRDVAEPGNYFITRVMGIEVFLQNLGGELVAFRNTCPHRFSAIHVEPRGNRPLECSYHRWRFDREGRPTSIPFRSQFHACAADLRLEAWKIESCGEMLFVSAASSTTSLDDYLGACAPRLRAVADNLGSEILSFESTIKSNWKLIIQNTVEFYHAYSVHPGTFAPLIPNVPQLIELEASAPHIAYVSRMKEKEEPSAFAKKLRRLYERSRIPLVEGYEHVTLYPCSTVGATDGLAFAFFQYFPLGPRETLLKARAFLPTFDDFTRADRMLLELLTPSLADVTKTLSDEDARICEAVQRGVDSADEAFPPGLFCSGEVFVRKFQEYYTNSLKSSA